MKSTYTHLKYLLAVTLLVAALQNQVLAGGFPVRPRKLTLSPSATYFVADRAWDANSHNAAFANNGRFTSQSYSLYAEYGLSRRFTMVALLPYVINTYEDNNSSSTYQGPTDLEVGLRYYLANINYIYYFTIQSTFVTPLYTEANLGYKQNGAEVKLAFAGSGKVGSKNYYFTVEDGVRQYFGTQGPTQMRYNGSFGLTLDRKFRHQISISAGGTYSTSTFTTFNTILATNKNFAFTQASLTYGYTFGKRVSMFLTAGKFITGRNTGDGRSGTVALVLKPW